MIARETNLWYYLKWRYCALGNDIYYRTDDASFLETLRTIHRNGFFLVPDIADTWASDWACFHLVPLSQEVEDATPSSLLRMTVHPRYALQEVCRLGLAYSPESADEFNSLLRRVYPSLSPSLASKRVPMHSHNPMVALYGT